MTQAAFFTTFITVLQVILPGGVTYAEVVGASAVSKVVQVGGALNHSDAWLLLWEDGVSLHPINRNTQQAVSFELSALSHHGNKGFYHCCFRF